MELEKFLHEDRIIDLKSNSTEGSLREIVEAICSSSPGIDEEKLLNAILSAEKASSTAIGEGVLIPHARMPLPTDFVLGIGRSRKGIEYYAPDIALVHLVIVIAADEKAEDYLKLLATIADLLRDKVLLERIQRAEGPSEIYQAFTAVTSDTVVGEKVEHKLRRLSKMTFTHAQALADEVNAQAMFVYADALPHPGFLKDISLRHDVIIVSERGSKLAADEGGGKPIIRVPLIGRARTGQMRVAALLSLARGLIRPTDTIVCVSGIADSGVLDTIAVLDVEKEHKMMFPYDESPMPEDVNPAVFEQVMELADELAVEGREGRPVGTIFVLGDTESVLGYCKQLVLNPFHGYDEEQRNILDPCIRETVKEFSTIDGAFIIRGDGVIVSAGTYLSPDRLTEDLPQGLGTRHEAAAATSVCTNAMAITISASTRNITIFRKGKTLFAIEKPKIEGGRGNSS